MKKIMKLILALVVGLTMTACGGNNGEEKVIVVGTAPNFVPFEYMEGDEIVGFDMDLLKEVEKESGLKFKVVGMDFSGLLPALQTKKIDMIMSGMSVTEDRKKNVNFTKTYFNVSQVIMIGDKSKDIKDESGINNKKIGVVMGTTSDTLAEGFVKKLDGVEVIKYNKLHEAALALQAEKIGMIILDNQQAKKTIENNKGLKLATHSLNSEEYAIAMRKDEEEILSKINIALSKILESKEYDQLIEKYID